MTALPDDIEQFLIVGQRLRASVALAERRGITLDAADMLVGRWLFEQQRAIEGRTRYGRRRGDRSA
jgi:hypothetical protein